MSYKTMPGAHEETRENPAVRSKFDKSQGRGLPAPHLSHPGEVAKETGSKHPGHTENGHMLPKEVSMHSGGHKVTHHAPATLGSGMADGRRAYGEPNMGQTDRAPESTRRVGLSGMLHGNPEDASGHDRLRSEKQHDTRKANVRLGTEERGSSRQVHGGERVDRASRKADAGALAGSPGSRNRYTGGKGRI